MRAARGVWDLVPDGGCIGRDAGPRGGFGVVAAGAVAAEWVKTWSVRSTWWGLGAALLLMVAAAGQLAIYTVNAGTNTDPADDRGVVTAGSVAVQAVDLAQFAVIAVAMLLVTAEYAAGTMRTSLQWVPRRGVLLAAKAAVTGVVCAAAGAVMAVAGTVVAVPLLGRWGVWRAGETFGDVAATAVYLGLVGMLTLGVGAALRSAVVTLTVVFLGFTVVPASLRATDLVVAERIADCLPGPAGTHFLRGDTGPYPPVVGLLVLAAWAVGLLVAGWLVLRRRDA